MLSQCIQYPFYKGDFLPETICLPRLKDAKSAFKIITKCRGSHQFLKESEMKGWPDDKETFDPHFQCYVKKEENIEDIVAISRYHWTAIPSRDGGV